MMWKYFGIIFLICPPFIRASSVFSGKCTDLIPENTSSDMISPEILNGTIWTPIRHFQLTDPRYNIFHSSPYLILNCIEFQFEIFDEHSLLNILPVNCSNDEACWMEQFLIKKQNAVFDSIFTAELTAWPSNCVAPFTSLYIMTPDIDKILILWNCFDYQNGSVSEGIWMLRRSGVELDFEIVRRATKMINSLVPLEFWQLARDGPVLCTCMTRFGSNPCMTDEQCIEINENDYKVMFAASVGGHSSQEDSKGGPPSTKFLLWFFIGVATFAATTLAFIHLSGISECLCNENYHAF